MNLDTEERTFEGQAFCSVLERDVHVACGMRSKSDLRCTGWYLWEYRLGYSLLIADIDIEQGVLLSWTGLRFIPDVDWHSTKSGY